MASGINVGGTWKDITAASVNVGGTWKTVSNIHINVAGTWKEAWSAGGAWTPASLFASSEVGCWFDPSDLTTMWTDDGVTQASVNDAVYRIDDKSGNGNHARQATLSKRPILRQSGSLYYLEFDGTDDFLVTAAIDQSATDNFTFAAGIWTDTTPAVAGIIGQFGDNDNGSYGAWFANPFEINTILRGTAATYITNGSSLSTSTPYVATHYGDISVIEQYTRLNGAADGSKIQSAQTGNLSAALPLHIGSREGVSYFLDGRVYSLVVRNLVTSGDDLTNLESYVAGKTGVTLA